MYSKELLSSLPVRSLIQICNIKVCPVVNSSVYRNLVVLVDITMQLGTLRQVDAAAVSVEYEMVLASLTGFLSAMNLLVLCIRLLLQENLQSQSQLKFNIVASLKVVVNYIWFAQAVPRSPFHTSLKS